MRLDRNQFLLLALAVVAGIVIGRASARRPAASPASSSPGAATAAATANTGPPIDRSVLTVDGGEPSPEVIAAIRRQATMNQRAYATAMAPMQALSLMRMHLRELITAEEAYMAENGAYTDDYERLALMDRGDSVTVEIRWAGPAGWVAEATHPAFAEGSCVAGAGAVNSIPEQVATRRDGLRPEASFHVTCDPVRAR